MLVTQAQVRERVALLTDAEHDPPLADADIDVLLEMGKRVDRFGTIPDQYTEWAPGVAHAIGDTIVTPGVFSYPPALISRNGFFYTVTQAGTTGATQPVWPGAVGGTTTDGTVHWINSGTVAWHPTYDVNFSVAQGWLLKASRLAGHYNFMTAGKMLSRQQFYDHCMKQYRLYSSKSGPKTIRFSRFQDVGDALSAVMSGAGVVTSVDG